MYPISRRSDHRTIHPSTTLSATASPNGPKAIAATLVTAAALALLLSVTVGDRELPAAAEPAIASTGQIDLSIEPAIPTVAVPLIVGADEKPALVDGKATPTTYVLFSFKPPANRMFELRLFAPEGHVAMTIFRGAAKSPEPGAGPAEGAIMWMSSADGTEELRILVRGRVAGETPFKLGAKLYPKGSAND